MPAPNTPTCWTVRIRKSSVADLETSACGPLPYDGSLISVPTDCPDPKRRPKGKQTALMVVAALLSALCMIWVLKDFEWAKFGEEVSQMDWRWVGVAAIADVCVYALQGWRWSLLLRPVADIPFGRSIRAVYVGLFANEVLPLKPGEIIRCYLQGRWSGLPFTVVLSSALIERIFDGLWLLICLGVAAYYTPMPKNYIVAGEVLAIFIAAAVALLLGAMYFRLPTERLLARHRHTEKIIVMLDDLYLMGHSRYLYIAAIASLPYMLLQVVPIYAVAQAYNMDVSPAQGLGLMVILRLIAIVPQAPGNLGAFQAAAAYGLTLFNFEAGISARYSFVLWGVVTLPLVVVGFIASAITGLKLRELRDDAKSAAH